MFLSFFFDEYFLIFLLLVISILLSGIIFGLSFFLSISKPDVEKLSIYECGFDPYEDARNSFDIKFYLVAILFIIFDLEVMFLFPWIISLSQITSIGFWIMIDFLIELVIGFVYAWKVGSLE